MRLAIVLVLLTSACNGPNESSADPWGREPDPALALVSERDAPTVKALVARGFLIVDERGAACDGGSNAICDGFDALYLGRENGRDGEALAEFACPGTEAPSDEWKCRELDPPYVPNGGFRPVSGNGS